MDKLLDFLGSSALLPTLVSLSLVVFLTFGKKFFDRLFKLEILENEIDLEFEEPKVSYAENVSLLVGRDDVSLRVLEELFASSKIFFHSNPDSRRVYSLYKIQSTLRDILRESIKSEDFPVLRDRVLMLIDEAQKEIDQLQERKPFEGLQEPEKSLLVDLLAELPSEKSIPKQKALQLAEIIKIKHQDMLSLQKENAKSASWTRWGTYGTVLFGILSVILSIYTVVR